MPARTSMLHVRVDDEIKEKATVALESMGLSVSEAVRLFLHRVVTDQALPLALRVPRAETRAAMVEADAIVTERQARFPTAEALFADLEDSGKR